MTYRCNTDVGDNSPWTTTSHAAQRGTQARGHVWTTCPRLRAVREHDHVAAVGAAEHAYAWREGMGGELWREGMGGELWREGMGGELWRAARVGRGRYQERCTGSGWGFSCSNA